MKIAIVGGGPSGTSVLRELVNSSLNQRNLHIDVFESRERLVVGQAYEEDTHEAIMNEHARDLSILSEEPYDFLYWLEEHHPEWATRDAFVPRPIYGDYLYDRLHSNYQQENVRVIHKKIVDLTTEGNMKHIRDEDGKWYQDYLAVFFAIGHPPYADHYNLVDEPNYINQPFPIDRTLNKLGYGMDVGVIGSGLTSLDIVKYLVKSTEINLPLKIFIHNEEPFHTVKFYRYDGDLQISFNYRWIDQELDKGQGYIPLDTMIDTYHNDLAMNEINYDRLVTLYGNGSLDEIALAIVNQDEELSKLRRYIVIMTQYLPDLFNALSPIDRDIYQGKHENNFNHFRSQMPSNSLEFILDHIDQGTIEIIPNLDEIYPKEDSSGFHLYTIEGDHHEMDILVNAAGFEFDLSSAVEFDPLLKSLYEKEYIVPYYRGGIHVTWPNCELVTNQRGKLNKVYLLGHWISKIHYGNNNIHLCIKQAKRVVKNFIHDLG